MALQSKAITADGSRGHHRFTLTVTENSTSIANNTSSVSWALVISPVQTGWDWVSNQGKVQYSVVINGATYSGIIATYDGVSTVTIASGTETCWHDAAGALTISFSFSITDSTGWSFAPGNASARGSLALTNIPRQANITAAPNFNDEENPTITFSNPAGSSVTELAACISVTGEFDDVAYRTIRPDQTSFTFDIKPAEREALWSATTKSNSRSVVFILRTLIGGQYYYSTLWRTLTIVNANPVIEPSITDVNAAVTNVNGGDALVRYVSNAYFETNARAQKRAWIVSQGVTCAGVTLEGERGTFYGVQSGDFVFTVTDSRGNTTTLPVPKPFVNYVGLSCSIGNTKPDTYGNFTLTASGVSYNGDITGAGSNDLYVLYRYKVAGGAYGDWHEMSITKGTNNYTATATLTGLDYQTTYIFQCKAGDLILTATTEEVAIKSTPVFDWSGTDFNFNVPVKIGGVELDYIVEQGVKAGWNYRQWSSGLVELWVRKSVTVDISNPWGALYTSGQIAATNLVYPQAFATEPNLTVTLSTASAGALVMVPGGAGTNTASRTQTGVFELARGTALTGGTYILNYYVIGRLT